MYFLPQAFLPVTNIIPAVDKKNVSRNYLMNDTVCCEVIEVIPDTDKMVCGMKGVTRGPDDPPPKPPLGLLSTDDFPLVYKYVLTKSHTLLSNHIFGPTLFYRSYCFTIHKQCCFHIFICSCPLLRLQNQWYFFIILEWRIIWRFYVEEFLWNEDNWRFWNWEEVDNRENKYKENR